MSIVHNKGKKLGGKALKKLLLALSITPILFYALLFTNIAYAEMQIPDTVKNISRQNTYPNADTIPERVQPSQMTQTLLETSDYQIDNPNLIRLLNESTIKNSILSFGARSSIYLGNWALSYESKETTPNWEYVLTNTNYLDNRQGSQTLEMTYRQNNSYTANGGLTTPATNEEDVKSLMMIKAQENSGLNLSFQTTIGKETTSNTMMKIPPKKVGYIYSYVPAINEKGTVIYGEVYLQFKGYKSKLVIKNVTNTGVSAWIPIQDYISYKYNLTDKPKDLK